MRHQQLTIVINELATDVMDFLAFNLIISTILVILNHEKRKRSYHI